MSKNKHSHNGSGFPKHETPWDYEAERKAREAQWETEKDAGILWMANDPYRWYSPNMFPESVGKLKLKR